MNLHGRSRRGLSQVVTSLILLVVAVLLAGVVTYYATNMTTTRTEVEDVQLTFDHVWVNSTGAISAFKMKNLGGRDLLIDKITVRGVECSWNNVYYYRVPSGTSVTDDLDVATYSDLSGASATIGGNLHLQASTDIPLASGGELLVYIKDPDNIQVDDIGTAVDVVVQTARAQYMTECNVESATTQ
jgi:flagellin-like protein